MDVLCQNSTAPTDELEYATTLLINYEAKFNMNITYYITLGFELFSLDLNYAGYDQAKSKINVQSKLLI